MQFAKVKLFKKGLLVNSLEDCSIEIKLDKIIQIKTQNQILNVSYDNLSFSKEPNNRKQTIFIKNFSLLIIFSNEVQKFNELIYLLEEKSQFFNLYRRLYNLNLKSQLSLLKIDTKNNKIKIIYKIKDIQINNIINLFSIESNLNQIVYQNNLVEYTLVQSIDLVSQENIIFSKKFDQFNKNFKYQSKYEIDDDQIIEFKSKNENQEISLICSGLVLLDQNKFYNNSDFGFTQMEKLFEMQILNIVCSFPDHNCDSKNNKKYYVLHKKYFIHNDDQNIRIDKINHIPNENYKKQRKQLTESHKLMSNYCSNQIKQKVSTKFISKNIQNVKLNDKHQQNDESDLDLTSLKDKQNSLLSQKNDWIEFNNQRNSDSLYKINKIDFPSPKLINNLNYENEILNKENNEYFDELIYENKIGFESFQQESDNHNLNNKFKFDYLKDESFVSCINEIDDYIDNKQLESQNDRRIINQEYHYLNQSYDKIINQDSFSFDQSDGANLKVALNQCLQNEFKQRKQFIQNEKGTLQFKNNDHIYNILKKCFSNPLKIISNGFSPPIFCFIPKSFLQTAAEYWQNVIPNLYSIIDLIDTQTPTQPPNNQLSDNIPITLTNPTLTPDSTNTSTFQLKQILAKLTSLLVASRIYLCEPMKPFNPIWGETYSCEYEDGTQGFFEQVSHHPPIVNFQIIKEGSFKIQGSKELGYKFNLSQIEGQANGQTYVEFIKSGYRYKFDEPTLALPGQLYFDMVWTFFKQMNVQDLNHDLKSVIYLDADNMQGNRWQKGMKGDRMVGFAADNIKAGLIERQRNPIEQIKNKLKQESDTIILNGCIFNKIDCEQVKGLEFIKEIFQDVDDDDYNYKIINIQEYTHKLQSDSTLRKDIIKLQEGDEAAAHDEKVKLEVLQRQDRKLRADYETKYKLKKIN